MFIPLNFYSKLLFLILSFILVAFGQPAWNWWMGLIASCAGFALFWRVLLDISKKSKRFYLSMAWYGGIQTVHLSWMASHPYMYIYGVILFCAVMTGTQFGIIGLFIEKSLFTRFYRLLAVAGLWTLMEWSRLFVLSGLSFNPIGIALTGALYPLQFASLGGVYFLSFWIILTNLLVLRMWLLGLNLKNGLTSAIFILLPYLFGVAHVSYHTHKQNKSNHATISAALVQTAFPVEETMGFKSAEEARQYVLHEWHHILALINKHRGRKIDLIVLPEYVVPYGTFSIFRLDEVKSIFKKIFGEVKPEHFPPLENPFAEEVQTNSGIRWRVSNAYFVQTLANIFHADVLVGLEGNLYNNALNKWEAYSSAFHFSPGNLNPSRYDKRVLVPMGEYIPFSFCRSLAAKYGIQGSFIPGEEAKVFPGKVPYSPSICYEETYGDIMREGRVKGAELLVNITNDAWYPSSRLPQQHFDHARLRSVENGIPIARACNTGVTAAVDSLGRTVAILGEDSFKDQWKADSLLVDIPTYHYQTVYSQFGDLPLLLLCSLFLLGFIKRKKL